LRFFVLDLGAPKLGLHSALRGADGQGQKWILMSCWLRGTRPNPESGEL